MENLNQQFKEDLLARIGELRLCAFPGETFGDVFNTVEEADAWAAEQDGTRDVYFHGNPGRGSTASNKRLRKIHTTALTGHTVDIDPPKGSKPETWPAWQERTLARIETLDPKPTYVVFSGRGFQLWYLFKEPENLLTLGPDQPAPEALIQLVESRAKALGAAVAGDDLDEVAFTIDHIWRWPGTRNLKEGAGVAKVLLRNDVYYEPRDFPVPKVVVDDAELPSEYTPPAGWKPRTSIDGLHPKSETTLALISLGYDADAFEFSDIAAEEALSKTDRSKLAMRVACDLLRGDHSAQDAFEVLMAEPEDLGIGHAAAFASSKGTFKRRSAQARERQASRAVAKAIEAVKAPAWFEELSEQYFIDQSGDCKVIERWFDEDAQRIRFDDQSFAAFQRAHDWQTEQLGEKQVGRGTLWLRNPSTPRYRRRVFWPGKEKTVLDRFGNPMCNIFRGLPFGEGRPGDQHERALELIHDVVCAGRDDEFQWFLNWMAFGLQNPGQLAMTAPVLMGAHGIGKGFTLKHIIGRLYGEYFAYIGDQNHVSGRFGGTITQNKLYIFVDEAAANAHLANVMKSRLTEKEQTVENKGVNVQEMIGHANWAFCANRSAVEIEEGDRRYACFDVLPDRKGQPEYFEKIRKELEKGGYDHLAHAMINRDLGDWQPGTLPRDSAAKQRLANETYFRSRPGTREVYYFLLRGATCDGAWAEPGVGVYMEVKELAASLTVPEGEMKRLLYQAGVPGAKRPRRDGVKVSRNHFLFRQSPGDHLGTWLAEHTAITQLGEAAPLWDVEVEPESGREIPF